MLPLPKAMRVLDATTMLGLASGACHAPVSNHHASGTDASYQSHAVVREFNGPTERTQEPDASAPSWAAETAAVPDLHEWRGRWVVAGYVFGDSPSGDMRETALARNVGSILQISTDTIKTNIVGLRFGSACAVNTEMVTIELMSTTWFTEVYHVARLDLGIPESGSVKHVEVACLDPLAAYFEFDSLAANRIIVGERGAWYLLNRSE